MSTFRGQKVVKHGNHRGISFLLLIELGPICNSMAASLAFKSSEGHSLLKNYNGGLLENIWAATWDFQQCGLCDQQSLRSACAYAQSDQSLC